MIMDTDIQVAELNYTYNGKKVAFVISESYGEVSWGYDNEDTVIDSYIYDKIPNVNMKIKEYETPREGANGFVVEFSHNKLYYCLSGSMAKEEMEKIIENLYFL